MMKQQPRKNNQIEEKKKNKDFTNHECCEDKIQEISMTKVKISRKSHKKLKAIYGKKKE